MKSLLLLLLVFSQTHSQTWKLIWSDEFEKPTIDLSKWNFDTVGNVDDWWNNESQNYTTEKDSNVWIESGSLVIEARYEKNRWPGDNIEKDYTSARLTTKNKGDWKYGKFEIKAKLPTGNGTWPAIWLLASEQTYGNWPESGEVDIMENLGNDPDIIHGTIHCGAYNHVDKTAKEATTSLVNPFAEFHIYSVIWTPDSIKIGVDNNFYFGFANENKTFNEWPFDKKFHLILNVALGGWGGIIDNSILPQKMFVDYVRVFEDTSLTIDDTQSSNELVLNSTFDSDISPWIFSTNNGSVGSISVVNKQASIAIAKLGTNIWDVQLSHIGIALLENETYTLKFSVKSSLDKSISVGIAKNYGDYSPFINKTIKSTSTMQDFEIVYNSTISDADSRIFFDIGSDVNGVVFDNIYLTKTTSNIKSDNTFVVKTNLKVYPNPFNPSTTILFTTPNSGGSAQIYNIKGETIQKYNSIKRGENRLIFNGKNLASGIYFVKVHQDNYSYTKKMILLK